MIKKYGNLKPLSVDAMKKLVGGYSGSGAEDTINGPTDSGNCMIVSSSFDDYGNPVPAGQFYRRCWCQDGGCTPESWHVGNWCTVPMGACH